VAVEEPVALPEPGQDLEGPNLTDGALYGAMETGTKPDEKPPEKPDEKPKDKPKAAKTEPKADAKPDEKAAAAAEEQRRWDEERQRRDQEHANERKVLEGQIGELKGQLTALQTQLTQAVKKDPGEDPGKKRLLAAGQLEGLVAGMEGEDDPQVIAAAVRKMAGLMTEFVASPTPGSAVDASAIDSLIERLDKIEQGFDRIAAETAAQASEAGLERLLRGLDTEFGAKHRNAAMKAAREALGARGFTETTPPTAFETELVLRNAYMAEAAGDKKPGELPKGRAGALPGDPGSGGTAAPFAAGPAGTLQEVLADKLRKGELRR
jgi:hypothetical protein